MLDAPAGGKPQAAQMSLDDLKQQIQDKMRAKKAAAAAEEKAARRASTADDTDRLRAALQGGKRKQGKGGGKQQGKGGGSGGKGFGG